MGGCIGKRYVGLMKNVLSFDIEEWFHPEIFNNRLSEKEKNSFLPGVERNVDFILNILNRHQVKATFFILGWVAEKFPDIVPAIEHEGHEIASHGYSHRMITQMNPPEFRNDLEKSLNILNSLSKNRVVGFRAPTFSVIKDTLWALPIMSDLGIEYDSSVYPIIHDRYGIPDAPRQPFVIYEQSGKNVIEFPMPTVEFKKFRVPVGGGGYFRLYPYFITNYLMKKAVAQNIQLIFYAHPWEFDKEIPRIKMPILNSLRHYTGIHKMGNRLNRLLDSYSFTSFRNLITSEDFNPQSSPLKIQ